MPPVVGSSEPLLLTTSALREPFSTSLVNVISPVTFVPVSFVNTVLRFVPSQVIVWSASTVNVIGEIVLYLSGVLVSVRVYLPSSRPLNVKVVPSSDFTTATISVSLFGNNFVSVNSAPVRGFLSESTLLITTLYVNTITLSHGVSPVSGVPPCSWFGLLENSSFALFRFP